MKIDAQTFESLLEQYQQRVNQALGHWLPADTVNPVDLHKAMRYSVLAPGKRVYARFWYMPPQRRSGSI